jgi:hypothetical protein
MNGSRFFFAFAVTAVVYSAARADILDEAARQVEGRTRRASSGVFDPESNRDSDHIGPGERRAIAELPGPGEVRHIWFTFMGLERRSPRTLILRIYWDGAETPSVETPLGDFFAAGHGMRADVNSLPIQATSYGRALNCYWRMPFRSKARIELENQGRHDLCVYYQIDWLELPRPPEGLLYFHARYRQESPAKPFTTYTIFDGVGEGQYVGTVLSIQTALGTWFGEADDRFSIDGEEEPSLVGTGTEDYFNDAWNLRLFSNANTGVTIKEPNAEDCRFTGFRWHLRPPVTFRKSLKVEYERRSFAEAVDPATGERKSYDFKYRPDICSSVAFWYAREVAPLREKLPAVEERMDPEIVVEAPDMVDRIRCSPEAKAARRSSRVCHQKRMLLVENDGIGGWFEVPCKVDEPGRYSISVFQRLFRTEGIWKVSLRGPEGEIVLDRAMDFFDPFLAQKENRPENFVYGTWLEKKVGIHELQAGDHTFRFVCIGSNPLARSEGSLDRPGLNCGIDGMSLRRIQWEEPAAWIEKHLAEEAKLFAARIEETRKTVDRLAAAVDAFRKEKGAFPRGLEELGRIPRDPWGQSYRFTCPGTFHPGGFDVYSVHGDSRAPSGWIGNWSEPFRFDGAVEGEDLVVLRASPGASASSQEIEIGAVPPLSGKKILFVKLPEKGSWIELGLPQGSLPRVGGFDLRLVTSRDYGILRITAGGTPFGGEVDGFTPKIAARAVPVGRMPPPGDTAIRIEAVGRNPRSTGFYAGIDALVPSAKP